MLAEILSKFKAGISMTVIVIFTVVNLSSQSNIFIKSANKAASTLDFFTNAFHSFRNGFVRIVDSYGNYAVLKTERDALRKKLENTQDLYLLLKYLEEENNRLRKQLDFKPVVQYPVIHAEIISLDPDNLFRTIIVDKGSDDGVKPYMPVLAFQITSIVDEKGVSTESINYGIVGKIIQVTKTSSRILPISDQYSKLGVKVKRTGHWGLLSGQSHLHGLPKLDYITLDAILHEGDEIVTSGDYGIFPRDLPVGKVTKNIYRGATFQDAFVKPAIDIEKLETVMIINKEQVNYKSLYGKMSSPEVEQITGNVIEAQGK
ncbi:MAG: rod shape-determining protein MreC [Spirochaetia bacterium]|nr:rod shape-determining protein MreC [Spirochaetia bacterium]